MIVGIRGVVKRFGAVTAVNAVDLTVADGELFTLLGPSGCGKTTLLRLLAGFYQPDAGTIRFGDRVVNGLPPYERGIGMVFQNYALWPHMTVADNVCYGLRLRRLPGEEVARRLHEGLRKVNLVGFEARYPGQLSGGQQQRVALARALVLNPDILLLDEPLSNLDAKIRIQVRAEIRRLQQDLRITTVYVTHDQEEALSLSDRVAVMRDGHVLQVGRPRELYERPRTRFVADFVGKVNVLPAVSLGGGRYRAGRLALTSSENSLAAGQPARLYLRPEDRVVDMPLNGQPNQISGRIAKIEYLGGHCLAQMQVAELEGQPLSVYFSLNQMRDLGIREGSELTFALRADRIRVFAS